MKVLFYTDVLNYTGTRVAVEDYATYNEQILGNTSILAYDATKPFTTSAKSTSMQVVRELESKFPVLPVNPLNWNSIVDAHKVDHFYALRAGAVEPLPTNCRTSVHVVFKYCYPHGDTYAYVSEWLAKGANQAFGCNLDFVPHIVQLPSPTKCLRADWQIPTHAKVIGRHGGLNTFDVPIAHTVITRLLEYRTDYWFVFLNTAKWIDHPRVLFLDAIYDAQQKANFISSCDAMIHARRDGESFGCAVAEFLYFNKPVISWTGGYDQNHLHMLQGNPLMYENEQDLELKLNSFYVAKYDWHSRVVDYSPPQVMNKFKSVFFKHT
jgi:hypothetical protein